jgi:hypothetical protein
MLKPRRRRRISVSYTHWVIVSERRTF